MAEAGGEGVRSIAVSEVMKTRYEEEGRTLASALKNAGKRYSGISFPRQGDPGGIRRKEGQKAERQASGLHGRMGRLCKTSGPLKVITGKKNLERGKRGMRRRN